MNDPINILEENLKYINNILERIIIGSPKFDDLIGLSFFVYFFHKLVNNKEFKIDVLIYDYEGLDIKIQQLQKINKNTRDLLDKFQNNLHFSNNNLPNHKLYWDGIDINKAIWEYNNSHIEYTERTLEKYPIKDGHIKSFINEEIKRNFFLPEKWIDIVMPFTNFLMLTKYKYLKEITIEELINISNQIEEESKKILNTLNPYFNFFNKYYNGKHLDIIPLENLHKLYKIINDNIIEDIEEGTFIKLMNLKLINKRLLCRSGKKNKLVCVFRLLADSLQYYSLSKSWLYLVLPNFGIEREYYDKKNNSLLKSDRSPEILEFVNSLKEVIFNKKL